MTDFTMVKAKGGPTPDSAPTVPTFDHKRDAYGFALRPQHVHRYREYASIYKEEEEERLDRWKDFLKRQAKSARSQVNGGSSTDKHTQLQLDSKESEGNSRNDAEALEITDENFGAEDINGNASDNEDIPPVPRPQTHGVQIWNEIRPSLSSIENMMSSHVKTKFNSAKEQQHVLLKKNPSLIEEARTAKGASEEDSDEEFYDLEKTESDTIQDVSLTGSVTVIATGISLVMDSLEPLPLWKEELECLVQGGVPMSLRGELWQAFVGVNARRVEKYYQGLLSRDTDSVINEEHKNKDSEGNFEPVMDTVHAPEKWKAQIEKDLPRTFPGHPALDDNGRNALRRLLTAYARHNPSVGYCQAMNFFAGLLLLIMPEENAFWTLVGILDGYFDGYYSEEMIESQVDQLVLEELVHEKFPKLVNHLDYLGVQVAWVTGPWFLSIFMNILPWESVLRVWDVLLFEGNRVMLFRTALALMELYGPALVTTKDAGDAITLLQSLTGSTFDSSQLVLTACMAFQNVKEARLEELRNKHRPAVRTALEERTKGLSVWKDSQGLASKLYGFKHETGSVLGKYRTTEQVDKQSSTDISEADSASGNVDELSVSLAENEALDSAPDLQEQVVWLKVEFCKLLQEKRSAEIRAEELETALMEMVKQDNRRQLSARVEQLERDIVELRQALADKKEQESAMLQVLMRVEQDQKLTEDARRFAEQDAAAQRFAAQVLQEKYEEAAASLAEMEKRAIMAESMLEATMQYQSGQNKAQPSPRSMQSTHDASQDIPARKISLLSRPFGLGWRDKNKVKSTEEAIQKGKPNEVSTQLEKLGNLNESSNGKN